jgi:hypothetical protein
MINLLLVGFVSVICDEFNFLYITGEIEKDASSSLRLIFSVTYMLNVTSPQLGGHCMHMHVLPNSI